MTSSRWRVGLLLILLLAGASPAVAQGAPSPASSGGKSLHLHPDLGGSWGTIADLASPADWKCFDGQTHRIPGTGGLLPDPPNTIVHDLSHTHIGVCSPHGAEIPANTPITTVLVFQTFHLAGKITGVDVFFTGPCGHGNIPVDQSIFPMVGDPAAAMPTRKSVAFTWRPEDGLSVCIPKHGWFNMLAQAHIQMNDGGSYNIEVPTSYFSMIDPAEPIPPIGEAGVQLAGKTTGAYFVGDTAQNVYGIQLLEIRVPIPIYGPQSAIKTATDTAPRPQIFPVIGYAYSFNHCLPATAQYHLFVNADLHNGYQGIDQSSVIGAPAGGILFNDKIDWTVLRTPPLPTGLPPNVGKVFVGWTQSSGAGFDSPCPADPNSDSIGHVNGGNTIESWLSINIETNPNLNVDVCPNIPNGPHIVIPPGFTKRNGACVQEVFDACPNVDGNQLDAAGAGWLVSPLNGACYRPGDPVPGGPPPPPPPPPVVTPGPTGQPLTIVTQGATIKATDPILGAFVTNAVFFSGCQFAGGTTPYNGPFFSPGGNTWYAVGDHTITCYGNDNAGTSIGSTFTVRVTPMSVDPPPPPATLVLAPHGNVTAASPDGKPVVVSYTLPVASGGTPPLTVTCVPASGTAFVVGLTTVTCTARDAATQTATTTFTVGVTFTPPPPATLTIAAHPDVAVTTPTNQPVAVTYAAPAAAGGTPPVTVTCVPASGSVFPVGSTTVTCTARDAAAHVATTTFKVVVTFTPTTCTITVRNGVVTVTPASVAACSVQGVPR